MHKWIMPYIDVHVHAQFKQNKDSRIINLYTIKTRVPNKWWCHGLLLV